MKVKEFLAANPRKVVTVQPDTLVQHAMARLIENAISCLPVESPKGELLGIISDKDIFRAAHKNPGTFIQEKVKELMSSDLIVGVGDDDFDYIAGVMTNNRIRHVPIVDRKRLIGLISVGDVVKSQLRSIQIENRYLRKYILDSYPS
jgi:CBS domain-containing protein